MIRVPSQKLLAIISGSYNRPSLDISILLQLGLQMQIELHLLLDCTVSLWIHDIR